MPRVPLLSLWLAGCSCGGMGGVEIVCGDRVCSATESCDTCLPDCPCFCGDGQCSASACETCGRCPQDCGACREIRCSCGDGRCDPYYCAEACGPCPEDCGVCPDGGSCGDEVCGTDEAFETCPGDCSGPDEGSFRAGDDHCDPGDGPGPDCEGGSTCDEECATSCDCDRPWTVCGTEVGSARAACGPIACADCFRDGLSCSYRAGECDGATCED